MALLLYSCLSAILIPVWQKLKRTSGVLFFNFSYGTTMKRLLLLALSLFIMPALAANQTNILSPDQHNETAIFAGGCFWCMEPSFDKIDGVISTTSGYTSGHKKEPTYKEVSAGTTGHTEAIQVIFDSNKISYTELLNVFWRNIDPVAVDRQFCDRGTQYRSGIYYHDTAQEQAAKQSLQQLQQNKPFEGEITTEIVAATKFYPAEEYHQDYYIKNPLRYKYYRYSCGRDKRLSELWGEK